MARKKQLIDLSKDDDQVGRVTLGWQSHFRLVELLQVSEVTLSQWSHFRLVESLQVSGVTSGLWSYNINVCYI